MKRVLSCTIFALFTLTLIQTACAGSKTDALTGLPLYPSTSNAFDPGNPVKVPEATLCRSKEQADFYSVYDAKISAAVAWCKANLPGFHTTHAYTNGRSHDFFYNADGTLGVEITGTPGKDGEDKNVHGMSYLKLTPGLPESVFISLNQGKAVCP